MLDAGLRDVATSEELADLDRYVGVQWPSGQFPRKLSDLAARPMSVGGRIQDPPIPIELF